MEHVRMINMVTGTEMSVPADLVEKFIAAGHKLAAASVVEEAPAAMQMNKSARKKTATK